MRKKIKFGTDGWRGIIADDFTFDNVRAVAQATADYLLTYRKPIEKLKGAKGKSTSHQAMVVVGYDRRFLSDRFALTAARVLAGNGLRVILSSRPLPTQALSYSVIHNKAILGIMITASHNPPIYNGFKIKLEVGASADRDVTNKLETNLFRNEPKDSEKVEVKDLVPSYIKKVKSMVDMDLLKNARLRVVFDPMFGVGAGLLPDILSKTKCKVTSIHTYHDPNFDGLNPEPIRKNLGPLIKEVKRKKADIGVATDGDADRVGVVDDKGRYLTPHHVFPLLLFYLCDGKDMRGKVVQTLSLGYLSERIAREYNLPFQEVPVGFKYIAHIMLREEVLIGGEESGGYSFKGYIPDRDGLLNSLLFLEMIAREKKKLSTILDGLQLRFGKSYFDRIDMKMDVDLKGGGFKEEMTKAILKNVPLRIAGMNVGELKTRDGVKFMLGRENVVGGEAWLLLRPSGTEPLVRIYSEASSQTKVNEILKKGESLVRACV